MRKVLSALVLVLAIIVLPLGSWLYLKSGLEYRKGIQTEISSNQDLENTDFFEMLKSQNSNFANLDSFNNKATIVLKGELGLYEKSKSLHEQFRKAEKFQILCISDEPMPNPIWKNVVLDSMTYDMAEIQLIDGHSKLIGNYNFDTISMQKLIQHTAIIIPRKKEKDILVKSNSDG